MLKTTGSPDMSRPEVGNGNGEVVGFGFDSGGKEFAKKSGKLKGQNLVKSRKLSKSEKSKGKKLKKPSKSKNSPNFGTIEAGPNFLTFGARETFNRLWLAFIKAPILQHFGLKCHIWIEIDALSYAISGVLSQLASGTRPDR